MRSKVCGGESIRILLVEDNEAHAEMILRSFEDNRIANKIIHVDDGEKALDYLFGRGDYAGDSKEPLPDLILLDLRLPKVDGLQVLDEVKSSKDLKSIPVVILTTSAADLDVAKAYKRHANSFLIKPVDFASFTKMMDDLGYYWLVANHKPHT